MTKKKYLTLSAFFNLCTVLFIIFSTYQLKLSLDSGEPIKGIAALATGYNTDHVYLFFCGMILYAGITLLVKLIAGYVEKNKCTLISLILDIALLDFFVALGTDQIISGQITSNYPLLVAGGVMALAILLDLFSFLAERWGMTF